MQVTQNIQKLMQQAGARVTSAIQNASARTGIDFGYLLQQAKVESSFRTDVKAATSSATGLFQFTEGTWLDMVQKHGDKYGLPQSQSRQSILALRKDPAVSSLMAAEFAAENRDALAQRLNKSPADLTATDLYMAHFLGAGGAAQFLQAADRSPYATAAEILPQAAKANRAIFYDDMGRAKSVGEVYAHFDRKFSGVTTGAASQSLLASAPVAKTQSDDPFTRFFTRTAQKADAVPVAVSRAYVVDPVMIAELAQPEDGWSRFARATHNQQTRYNG